MKMKNSEDSDVVVPDSLMSNKQARDDLGGIGRTSMHKLKCKYDLTIIRVGGRSMFLASEIRALIKRLTDEAFERKLASNEVFEKKQASNSQNKVKELVSKAREKKLRATEKQEAA
ncbi:MAG: hypothetical protein CTY39_02665 [Hyphomicrobium sp.]|nr:MAG: hypothetical protein CTY39_02665 [Hyphomicrobium sp.]